MTVQPAYRICVRLDPAMLLENLMLKRFQAVPKGRRQEWIRGLLVTGYLSEVRAVRAASLSQNPGKDTADATSTARVAQNAFSLWLGQTRPNRSNWRTNQHAPASEDKAVASVPPRAENSVTDKPFAHLRKVIG